LGWRRVAKSLNTSNKGKKRRSLNQSLPERERTKYRIKDLNKTAFRKSILPVLGTCLKNNTWFKRMRF
jgi:hypothetical protein